MILHYIYVGHNKRRYFIEDENRKSVAYFDDLDTAAIVLRYLKGARLQAWEIEAAHRAMISFDARAEIEEAPAQAE